MTFCRLFADDNPEQHASNNLDEIEFTLNNDFSVLDKRWKKLLLEFNPCKTKTVFFSMNKHISPPKLFFQHCQLEFVPVHMYLGLFVSCDFGWSQYVNKITSTAYKKKIGQN